MGKRSGQRRGESSVGGGGKKKREKTKEDARPRKVTLGVLQDDGKQWRCKASRPRRRYTGQRLRALVLFFSNLGKFAQRRDAAGVTAGVRNSPSRPPAVSSTEVAETELDLLLITDNRCR